MLSLREEQVLKEAIHKLFTFPMVFTVFTASDGYPAIAARHFDETDAKTVIKMLQSILGDDSD